MLIGYARVSTPDQDPGYQLRALRERGCERIFTDRCTGRGKRRPRLEEALDFLRPNDALVVWRFDRVARSTTDMLALAAELERRDCELVSLTEAIDTATPGGKVVFTVMAALAQFEVDLNSERTKEAYRAKNAAGVRWGRPSAFHDEENVRVARALLADSSIARTEIAARFGVTRQTLYAWFPRGDPEAFDGRPHRKQRAA